jgi:hypothetical protein
MTTLRGPRVFGHELFYTSTGLLKWSITITVVGVGLHLVASFGLFTGSNWYNTPETAAIDVFTHSLAGMMVALWILNVNLGERRAVYWPIAIVATIVVGVAWEGFEIVYSRLVPGGTIRVFGARDVAQDLWQDTLGGVVACFIADETVE